MKARISLTEPVSERSSTEPDQDAVTQSCDEVRIQALIDAGVVTHKFNCPEKLDIMFAVSELHDLSEVDFVAAFKDGSIFLGCPDGPPESLADLVTSVKALGPVPATTRDATWIATGIDRIDGVSHRLEMLADALQPRAQAQTTSHDDGPGFDVLVALLEKLGKKMDRIGHAESSPTQQAPHASAALDRQLSVLAGEITKVRSGITEIRTHQSRQDAKIKASADQDAVVQQVSALGTQLQALDEKLAAAPGPLPFEHLEQKVEALRKDCERLANRPPPVLDLTEQRQSFANFTTAFSAISERLEAATEKLVHNDRDTAALDDVLSGLESLPARIVKEVSAFTERASFDAVNERMDGLSNAARTDAEALKSLIQDVAKRIDAKHSDPVNLDPLIEMLERLEAHSKIAPEALSALRSEVMAIAERPLPELDLTAQREGFARFATATATVMDRLEETVAGLNALHSGRQSEATEVTAVMQALPVILQQAVDDARANDPVNTAISKLRADFEPVPAILEKLGRLPDAMDALARRPDPTLNLTEHRSSLARFGTAMGTVLERLERVAGQLGERENSPSDSPAIEELRDIHAELGAMKNAQTGQLETLHARITEVSERLGTSTAFLRTQGDMAECDVAFPVGPLPLDEMRFLFAELVASQIQKNAATP